MANDLSIKVKVDLDSGDIKNIRTRFKEAFGKEGLKIKPEIDVSGMDKALKEVGKFRRELNNIQKNNKPIKLDVQADTSQVTSGVSKASAKIKKEFEDISKKTGSVGEQTKKLKADFKELEKVHINLVKADDERKIKGLKTRMDELNASISKTKAELASIKVPGVNTKNWTSNVEGYVNELRRDMIDNVNRKGRTAAVDNQYKRQVADEKNAARELEAIHRQNARIQKEGYQEIANSMREEYRLQKDILSAGEAETRVLNSQLEKTRARTSALREQYQLTQQQENKLSQLESKQSAHLAQSAARKADVESSKSTKPKRSFTETMDVYNMAQDGAMAVAGAVSALSEVDSKIAAVTRVANGSKKEMDEFTKSIYDNASKVGKTAPEYASAVEQWATAGFNLKNSVKLAKDSLIGSVVGDVDVNDMVDYMSIPLKAFEKEGLNSKDIINSMNEVSNENAIEMNDLGSAYSKASTQIASTNTSFSELTGMITGAQEATRAGGDVIGRSIKAVSLNFANMGNDLTKANAARHDWFSSIGVELTDSNGKLKSTYDIMDQLASKWNDLSENDQNTAAYYAAGKEHAAQFVGMLQQWKTVKKAEKEARDQVNLTDKENGSAFKEFAKQMDTIKSHLNSMGNAWMKLLADLTGGRDGINKMVDGVAKFADVLDKLVVSIKNNDNVMGALKFTAALVSIGLLKKAMGGVIGQLTSFGQAYKKNVVDNVKVLKETVANFSRSQSLNPDKKSSGVELPQTNTTYERVAPKPSSRKKKGGQKKYFRKVVTTEFKTKGTRESIEKTSRLSKSLNGIKKAGSVAMGAISVLSAGLGIFGVILDVIMVAMAGLELIGVDPWKAIERAINPAKAAAEDYKKTIDGVTEANKALRKETDANPITNKKFIKGKKKMDNLDEQLESVQKRGAETGDYSFNTDEFDKFKKDFNQFAKDNKLPIRVSINNYDSIVEQMQRLKTLMHDVQYKQLNDLTTKLNKTDSSLDKVLMSDSKNFETALGQAKSYSKELSDLNDKKKSLEAIVSSGSGGAQYGAQAGKELDEIDEKIDKLKETYKKGSKLTEVLNTKAGKQYKEAWNDALSAAKEAIEGIRETIEQGGMGEGQELSSNVKRLGDSKNGKEKVQYVQASQAMNLQQYGQQERIISRIQEKLSAGQQLTEQEVKVLAKQNSQLKEIDQSKWGAEQIQEATQAADELKNKTKENADKQREYMEAILTGAGVSKAKFKELMDAYEAGGSSYIKAMSSLGEAGEKALGITADFKARYKDAFGELQKAQEYIDSIPDEKVTKYAFIDENTGSIKTEVVDAINEIPEEKRSHIGVFYDKSGNADITAVQKTLNSMPKEVISYFSTNGIPDVMSLANALKDNLKGVKDEIRIPFYASTEGFDTGVQSVLKEKAEMDGKQAVVQFLADNNGFGMSIVEMTEWINNLKISGEKGVNVPINRQTFDQDLQGVQASLQQLQEQTQNTTFLDSQANRDSADQTVQDMQERLKQLEHYKTKLPPPDQEEIQKSIDNYKEQIQSITKEIEEHGGGNSSGHKSPPKSKSKSDKSKDKDKDKEDDDDKNDPPPPKPPKNTNKNKSKNSGKSIKEQVAEEIEQWKKEWSGDGKSILSGWLKNSKSNKKNKDDKKETTIEIKAKDSTKNGVAKARKSIQVLNKDKNSRISIAAKDSTKNGVTKARKSIQELNKAKNSQIKIKAKDLTKAGVTTAKKSLQNLNKGKNNEIKIKAKNSTAAGVRNAKRAVSKIKANPISIKAKNNTSSGVNNAKRSVRSIKATPISIKARNNTNSGVTSARRAVNRIKATPISIKARNNTSSGVEEAKKSVESIKNHHVKIYADDKTADGVKSAQNSLNSLKDKTVSVTVEKTENITTHRKGKGKSVAIEPAEVTNPNMLRSMSIVAGSEDLSQRVKQQAKSLAVRDKSESTQNDTRVDESYWRYMGHELYTGNPLDSQMSSLENSITKAGEDLHKIISLSRQRIDLDNRQIAYQRTMQGAYQDQMNDLLNKLRQKGFATNGNQITNLGHARDFVGDDASKVNELLSSYRSVYENLASINDKIDSLNTDIYNQQQNIKDKETELESKKIEELQRQLELLTTAISNNKSILDRKSESLSSNDYYLRLNVDAEQVNASSDAINQLVGQFNKLSVMTFSAPEQAKKIQESLNSIKTSILENADAVIKLRTEMKDAEIAAITSDLETFTNNLNSDIDRLKNNITNIQDGLLSGTSFGDLLSSEFDVSDFSAKSVYEQQIQDRLSLEKQLDDALDAFAKRNVDRTAQVANQQLQIEQSKYSELIRLTKEYSNGYVAPINAISAVYPSNEDGAGRQQALNIAGSKGEEYMKASVEYSREMAELKERYQQALDKAVNSQDKERINSKYIVEQMDLQRKIYESMIAADKESIETLTNKYRNENLSSDQLAKINESIANYKSNIMSAQNSIKEAVKARFDYENKMITEQMDKYKSLTDTLTNLVSISKALNLNSDIKGRLLDQQYASSYREYNNYLGVVSTLRNQQSQYDKGSYEWNLLDNQIDTFEKSISSSVNSLLDITKAQFENRLAGVQEEIEKSVNSGMTSSEAKFQDDTWYTGVQKELQLETMRQKTIDLENDVIKRRLEALDAQKEMSKAEADYVSKQIDLAVAEQKLNNVMGQKNVQVLEKGSDGKFNWDYVAKKEDVDAAKEAVNKARGELETARKQDRNDYITKVEQVISGAKDGSLKPEDVKSRLQQLNDSYKFILEDIPNFNVDNIEKIIEAYDDYVTKNKAVIKDYGQDSEIAPMTGYKDIVKDFNDEFKLVSKELGDIFGKELRDVLYQQSNNALRDDVRGDSLTIENMTLELPNIQDIDDFQRALKTLPDVAKQHAQGK